MPPSDRPRSNSPSVDLALFILRLMLAVIGVFHGSQKLFGAFGGPGLSGFTGFLESLNVPAPQLSAIAAGSAEFFGGLLVGVGLLTRLASLPFLFTMLVACATVHKSAFSSQNNGMEYPLTIAVMLLALVLAGPGRFSVDRSLFSRRTAPPPVLDRT